ncbi:MAG TPA: hypothetical protein VGU71_04910 [Candidatus Dormibacteraeota bacterium]|nr:hypothetical protein [Candidatus Dormibacteraeota bacterium]
MQSSDAPLPEDEAPPSRDARPRVEPDEPEVLTMVEVELPDGRYLLLYGRYAPDPHDA